MSTHTLHVLVVAVVALCAPSGCAQDLARASSSAIGCPHDAIDISEVSVGWSQMSWTAHCNGMDFYCSGEADATCAPEAFLPPERPEKRGPASPAPTPVTPPTQAPKPAPISAPTPTPAAAPTSVPTQAPTTDAVKPPDAPATTVIEP